MTDTLRLDDREAIRDCLHRYCRGIDRVDEAALVSSYWPDATDSHGAPSGPVSGFYDRVRAAWARGPRNVHQISNVMFDFRGADQAAVESAFLALQQGAGPDGVVRRVMMAGRYCDLFERRAGEWRVLRRTVVYDWVQHDAPFGEDEAARFGPRLPIGGVWPDDPVYHIA